MIQEFVSLQLTAREYSGGIPVPIHLSPTVKFTEPARTNQVKGSSTIHL